MSSSSSDYKKWAGEIRFLLAAFINLEFADCRRLAPLKPELRPYAID